MSGTRLITKAGISDIVEDTSPQLGGDLDLNSNSLDFPTTANISDCKDEDDMASNSATMLATQQSIKAYADAPQYILHIMNAGWFASDSNKDYIPLNGYIYEQNTTSNVNEYVAFVAPYGGELEKVIVRSEAVCGSSIVGFHKSPTATEVPNIIQTESITVSMTADDTAYAFNFTGTSSFNAGDVLAISFDPSNKPYDTNATIIFKFDTTQEV